MNLAVSISVYGGGPGSGCTGPNCGRPRDEVPQSISVRMKKAEDDFKNEVKAQGYDLSKVRIKYNPPISKGNFKMQSIADTLRSTGIIEFHPDVYVNKASEMSLKGIVAHELMHVKFNALISSGWERTEKQLETLLRKDGVSGYSQAVWLQYMEGKGKLSTAIHETLAEMARIKAETGKLPGATIWKDLYNKVTSSYGKAN